MCYVAKRAMYRGTFYHYYGRGWPVSTCLGNYALRGGVALPLIGITRWRNGTYVFPPEGYSFDFSQP